VGEAGREGLEECPALFVLSDGRVGVRSHRFAEAEVPRLVHVPDSETMGWWKLDQLVEDVDRLRRQQRNAPMTDLSGWEHSLFRLETLPQYLVDAEAERFTAFREGRPMPRRPPQSLDWFRRIAESVRAGKRWQRVHVVSRPLSEYLRYELSSYPETARLGYETLIADRENHPELADLLEDFYLLDAETDQARVVMIRYDSVGRPIGRWATDFPGTVERCRQQRDLALAAAVPLDEYLEQVGLTPLPTLA
jgi:hypothetical protein